MVLNSQPAIRIHLLGSVRVETRSQPSPERLTPTLQGLLAFLAIHRRRSHSRDVLFGHFWGDQPQARARHCLNTAVWRLRRVLEVQGTERGALLITEPDGAVGLRLSQGVWLDLAEFESAASRLVDHGQEITELSELEALEDDLQAPAGELLEGFYDEWALEARERFRSHYLGALSALCRAYRQVGAAEKAVRSAEAVLALDPLREDVVRELMRASVQMGNRGAAIRCYASLRHQLRTELSTQPMAETATLYHDITRDTARSSADADAALNQAYLTSTGLVRELRLVRRRLTRLIKHLQTNPDSSNLHDSR